MTSLLTVFLCSFVVFSSVEAVDYVLVPSDEPIQRCPGEENHFFDEYYDSSHIETKVVDDETVLVNGYAVFLQEVNPDEPISLKLKLIEYKNGQWRETALTMDREDICASFFDKNEIWYDLVKDFPKDCPPKKGEKYEFHNKSLTITIKNLSPGLEGLYKIETVVANSDFEFCFVIEGEAIRRKSSMGTPIGK